MKKCIIHIGMHKTGSTSIQKSLDGFCDKKFIYAKLGNSPNHSLAIYSLFSGEPSFHHLHIAGGLNKAAVNSYVGKIKENLEREIEESKGKTLIISGEDIGTLKKDDLERLHGFFIEKFDEVLIVGYVRPPAGYISSSFQQKVKGCSISGFNIKEYYRNYRETFEKFDNIFGRKNVILWKFDSDQLLHGCVVRDFCERLNIELPEDNIIKTNESSSRQFISMVYSFCKFSGAFGFKPLKSSSLKYLIESLESPTFEKFRFSPDIIRPILDDNQNDIHWMEMRLGQSLKEDLGELRAGDVKGEADLLRLDNLLVQKLFSLLGDSVPYGILGESPEDVAVLVDALRGKFISEKRIQKVQNLQKIIERLEELAATREHKIFILNERIKKISELNQWLTKKETVLDKKIESLTQEISSRDFQIDDIYQDKENVNLLASNCAANYQQIDYQFKRIKNTFFGRCQVSIEKFKKYFHKRIGVKIIPCKNYYNNENGKLTSKYFNNLLLVTEFSWKDIPGWYLLDIDLQPLEITYIRLFYNLNADEILTKNQAEIDFELNSFKDIPFLVPENCNSISLNIGNYHECLYATITPVKDIEALEKNNSQLLSKYMSLLN